jgi:hypothetical protein
MLGVVTRLMAPMSHIALGISQMAIIRVHQLFKRFLITCSSSAWWGQQPRLLTQLFFDNY